jgi:hypothetical protein
MNYENRPGKGEPVLSSLIGLSISHFRSHHSSNFAKFSLRCTTDSTSAAVMAHGVLTSPNLLFFRSQHPVLSHFWRIVTLGQEDERRGVANTQRDCL